MSIFITISYYLGPVALTLNVILLVSQIIGLRRLRQSINRWHHLNLVLEALCSYGYSLRGKPLAAILMESQGRLDTAQFDVDGFSTTSFELKDGMLRAEHRQTFIKDKPPA